MATLSASSVSIMSSPHITAESECSPHSVHFDCRGAGGRMQRPPLMFSEADIGVDRSDSELCISCAAEDEAADEAENSGCNFNFNDEQWERQRQKLVAQRLVAGVNNSSQDAHNKYVCPALPETAWPIGDPVHVDLRTDCRMCLRPDRFKYVTLNFRVMRHDSEMHVGQIINLCGVKRSALYTPIILDRWTRTLRIKIKATVKISLVFNSISARLGLRSSVGLKFCLDGFYGVEAFGDAFGNFGPGICPWMEVTGDASPISLKLEDNDNIYISIATEKMIELVRARVEQASEQAFKSSTQRSESLRKSRVSFASLKSDKDEGEGPTPRASLQEQPGDGKFQ